MANQEKDNPSGTLTAINILGVVGSFIGAANLQRAIAAKQGISLFGRAGKYFTLAELGVEGVQAVFLTQLAAEQIDQINAQAEANNWSHEQTLTAMMRIFAQLVVSYGLVIYSAAGYKSEKRGLLKKGLSEEDIAQMKPDDVVLINQLGEDEIARIGGTGAKRIEALRQLAISRYRAAINIYGVDESKLAIITDAKGQQRYARNAQQFAGKVYSFDPDTPFIQQKITKDPESLSKYQQLYRDYPKGVNFSVEGYPDFSPYIYKYKGKIVEVDIETLTESSAKDMVQANAKMKKMYPEWEQPVNQTWHHVENSTKMQLIPYDLHKEVGHTGGRATE